MEFGNTVNALLDRYDFPPADVSAQIERVREGKPAAKLFDERESLQVAAIFHMLRAAMDMHCMEVTHADNAQINVPAEGMLDHSTIKIALINQSRRHIGSAHSRSAQRKRALVWHKTALTCTITTNDDADSDHQFDFSRWRHTMVDCVRKSIAERANIICFGEFDFPPSFPPSELSDREAADRFNRELLEMINTADFPIILFAGTHHMLSNVATDDSGNEISAENIGYILFNKIVSNRIISLHKSPIKRVFKRTPAAKVGEILSRRPELQFNSYSTILGRIAFLICSDAYDPTIVLEIYAKSALGMKPDIIFVPAYNVSAKLASMCQILSLLTESVVILLDVCSESRAGAKDYEEQIWNCGVHCGRGDDGITFVGDNELETGKILFWELSRAKVQAAQQSHRLANPLKLFDEARGYITARNVARDG